MARSIRPVAADRTMADKERARKARKRDTDRQSQRHHRERHRAYVQSLEEMVNSYKQSCSRSSDPDVATLMADNERLRERCHRLESLLSRIKSLSSGIDSFDDSKHSGLPQASNEGRELNDKSSDTSRQTPQMPTSHSDLQVSSTSTTAVLSSEAQSQACQVESFCLPSDTQLRLNGASTFGELSSTSWPTPPRSLLDTSGNTCTLTDYKQLAEYGTMANLRNSNFPDNGFGLLGSPTTGTSGLDARDAPGSEFRTAHTSNFELQQCVDSFVTRAPVSAQSPKQQYQLSSSRFGPPCLAGVNSAHQAFPMTLESCMWDRQLLEIINEAKAQHAAGLYPTEKPTLPSVLSSRSSDVLAYRLYHFICSYEMPLHNFLAIFWVQYLTLRVSYREALKRKSGIVLIEYLQWYVLGTEAAYLQMPDCMKPTELEKRIPHSMSIGMLVWPDIRRTLIRDSSIVDTGAIGTALLHHLNSNWSPTCRNEGDFIGNTDVLSVIEREACSMDAWKISRKFGELNPQFAHCQLAHFD